MIHHSQSCPRLVTGGMSRGIDVDKDFILAEIRRTAAENGGKALGSARFMQQTGIRDGDWRGRYWARWSDAVLEAGIEPNELNRRFEIANICRAYANYAIQLGHLPVRTELKMKRRRDNSFPSWNAFERNGSKLGFIIELAKFCSQHAEFESVAVWCETYLQHNKLPIGQSTEPTALDGVVYLAKTRRGYKIGRTDDWEQRLRQIQLHNADDVQLVHLIKTDDPSGVEAYWHRRFKSKRVVAKSKTGRRRNWYNLTADDVRAFKRWKQI